jgi:hypothetical protein
MVLAVFQIFFLPTTAIMNSTGMPMLVQVLYQSFITMMLILTAIVFAMGRN